MIVEKFDDLLSHLNAEDNDMALELRLQLSKVDKQLKKLYALEAHGVDNWGGYDDAMSELEDN